jgi:cobalt-zinc-cadmium efflux system protein
MAHNHNHHHAINYTKANKAFVISIIFNFLFVLVEVISGLIIHSLSLLSDAGHNLIDVASLALALIALRIIKVKPTDKYTYGYKKFTILIALFNSFILLVSIGAIGYEAIGRFFKPQPLPGNIITIVAGIGIVINTITALMFIRDKDKDLNIKNAYVHLLSDAFVSLGLVFGGIIIYYTNYFWIDPLLSILISIVILISTWSLLRKSLKLSIDAVPEGINLDNVMNAAKRVEGVIDFHHVHIWAMSTTENALTAHLVISKDTTKEQLQNIQENIKHELGDLHIEHTTIETEYDDNTCEIPNCTNNP